MSSSPENHDALKLIGPQSLTRYGLRVAIFIVFGLASSTTASASCGNYLFRNGNPVSDEHFSTGEHTASYSIKQEATKIPAPPCHGPNCANNPVPLMPVPVAPTTLVPGFDQAAILEALAQMPSPPSGREIPESERGACFVPSSVFRPPIA